MPFLTKGKTNWKYILIILILALIVSGGILGWKYWLAPPHFDLSTSKYICRDGNPALSERLDKFRETQCLDCVMKTAYMCGEKFWIHEYGGLPGQTVNKWSGPYDIKRLQEFKEVPISPSKVEDETTNWKTYRNEEYGFEIKYPEDWITTGESPYTGVGEIRALVRFYPEIYHEIETTSFHIAPVDVTILIWNKYIEGREFDPQKYQYECWEKCPNLEYAYECWEKCVTADVYPHECWTECPTGYSIAYYFWNKDKSKTAEITLRFRVGLLLERARFEKAADRNLYSLSDAEIEKIFNQMLSTFRFLE
jgi:hypothetical protein